MPALDSAFAFAKMNDVVVFVGQNLYLDMTRTFVLPLDVNRSILERGEGLGLGKLKV